MKSERAFIAFLALLFGPTLSLGRWYLTKGPLETLAWVEEHGTPRDSVMLSNALYHASHAAAARAAKWSPTGYATHAVVGSLIGVGLLLSARRRRTT